MKKYIWIILLFMFTQLSWVSSQDAEKIEFKHNTFYAEIFGTSGSLFSFNYDRIIANNNNNLFIDLTMGVGYLPSIKDWNPVLGIPLSLNISKGHCFHYFEFGLGLTYASGIVQSQVTFDPSGGSQNSSTTSESLKAIWCSARIGYKYQRPTGGLFFRVGFTPLLKLKTFSTFNTNDNIIPLFGLGVGYTF